MVSVNPVTGEVLRRFPADGANEIERKLERAKEAFLAHCETPLAERANRLRKAAEVLESESQELGGIMTLEMGKPIGAAVQEAKKCATACRYYAENAARLMADEPAASSAARSFVRYQPLGPVLAVMPWNFPFWQVFRFAAPAVMAGNVGLLKHASNVPQCALVIEDVFRRAGFPEGVFQTLLVGSARVNLIIADHRIMAVTLTGSVEAGRQVAAEAGKNLKKTVLELGGSDPFIIMPSADLEEATTAAVQARTINNGQSCIAAKRFIVHAEIAEDFEKGFTAKMAVLKVGDPMDEKTEIGPLATADVLNSLEGQVRESVRRGARVLLGGKRLPGRGFFYAPTVLADIPKESPAYREELFGPVASVFRARDLEEALHIANDTEFGLGACLWSADAKEQEAFVERVEAGQAFVNGMVTSDPRLPFGGIKNSGYGRELGWHGLREFVNAKTVWVK
jgi:succinate-semialdehyde dehydrogenase / glutarate-semialdehyde dehydrogenase